MFCTLNVLFYVILHVQVEGTILCADEGLRPLLQEGIRQNNRDGRFCIQGISCISLLSIRDILVRIRIRIRGSLPLTNGSGSGS
jgi:hypothetical protein